MLGRALRHALVPHPPSSVLPCLPTHHPRVPFVLILRQFPHTQFPSGRSDSLAGPKKYPINPKHDPICPKIEILKCPKLTNSICRSEVSNQTVDWLIPNGLKRDRLHAPHALALNLPVLNLWDLNHRQGLLLSEAIQTIKLNSLPRQFVMLFQNIFLLCDHFYHCDMHCQFMAQLKIQILHRIQFQFFQQTFHLFAPFVVYRLLSWTANKVWTPFRHLFRHFSQNFIFMVFDVESETHRRCHFFLFDILVAFWPLPPLSHTGEAWMAVAKVSTPHPGFVATEVTPFPFSCFFREKTFENLLSHWLQ